MSKLHLSTSLLLLLTILLAACQPAPAATPDMSVALTQAFETALAGLQPSATPLSNETPVPALSPTAVAARTPPALPATFVASQLNPFDTPHTYIEDTCQYLYDKWSSNNAAPGTVVIVIMFHGITQEKAERVHDISKQDFKQLMDDMKEQGFEAINATQLADFLDHNTKIPPRSVVLVVDDRHRAESFNEHFRPYYQNWGWQVVNGWISAFGAEDAFLQENLVLANEGWVDYQSHGFIHNENMTDSSTDDFLRQELEGSKENLQTFFNKTPVAIIWPGGNFGIRPVQAARQYGYRVGFTINPRGPIMYNWVPLADQQDPARPIYLPEGHVNDPRMVLPRYWPNQVQANLDAVRNIGKDAAAYAEQNKATELEYYDIMCAPTMGAIP
ncbi:MAG TPA: polysaccharide deacetylase family protein [Anaerolineales bacterium]|nr:polysaccharide deacetylase family protein [Anaerolineales bacterium]